MTPHRWNGIVLPATLVALALLPGLGYADSLAMSNISFSNLRVTASSGTVQFQGPWNSQAFAEAQNSLGGLDSQFVSNMGGPSAAAAAVMFANASGNASVSPLSGAALSNASIPGNTEAQARSAGAGTLFNFFQITGASGPVSVTFTVDIAGMLNVMTDQNGLLARTETIFNLVLDGGSILSFHSLLSVGPNSTDSKTFAQTLSVTMSLNSDTRYFLVAEGDSESEAINIPEPSTLSLCFTALAGLVGCIRKKREL